MTALFHVISAVAISVQNKTYVKVTLVTASNGRINCAAQNNNNKKKVSAMS